MNACLPVVSEGNLARTGRCLSWFDNAIKLVVPPSKPQLWSTPGGTHYREDRRMRSGAAPANQAGTEGRRTSSPVHFNIGAVAVYLIYNASKIPYIHQLVRRKNEE